MVFMKKTGFAEVLNTDEVLQKPGIVVFTMRGVCWFIGSSFSHSV